MKKMVKKLSALLMAVIMVLAMSATAFADKVNDPNLAQSITVSNLSEGVETTLKLYNIIYLDRDTAGNETWTIVDWAQGAVQLNNATGEFTIDKAALKTAAEGRKADQTETETDTNHTFTNLPIGAYVILASDTAGTYGLMVANTYDENEKYLASKTADVVAKVEGYSVDKTADDKFVGIGSEVTFTVTTKVPAKTSINGDKLKTFKIKDTPVGLLIHGLPTVTIGGATKTITEDMVTNTVVGVKTSEYVVDLSSFIEESNAGATVTVTYRATVVDGQYNNKAGVESNTVAYVPGRTEGFTGNITITKYASDNNNDDLTDNKTLEGAKFKVYPVGEDNTVGTTALKFIKESDGIYRQALPNEANATEEIEVAPDTAENAGTVKVKGLAEGKYHFEETVAPDGYSINEDGVTVEVVENDTENVEVADHVIDTKLSSLPSTGGIGTTIFTIGGCVIMIVAAGLYFSTRKKEEN